MKNKVRLVRGLVGLLILNLHASLLLAQGTAFTYQGRLNDGGGAANGKYDLRFVIYDALANGNPVSGAATNAATPVTNGLLTVMLDFGAGVFTGPPRWLEIGVRTNGGGLFATLAPRQPLTPSPYAIFAASAANAATATSFSGAVTDSQLSANIPRLNGNAAFTGNVAAGAFTGNGAQVTNVNAATLNGQTRANFWQLGGNNVAGGQILGSTNNQPLEVWVNNTRALRLEPTTNDVNHSGIVNVVGGSPANTIAPGVYGSVIAGGGAGTIYGPSASNIVSADFSFLGGGSDNAIQANAGGSFLGGGSGNAIQANAGGSFLGGGRRNSILRLANDSFLGGGTDNNNADSSSFLGGGDRNSILAGAPGSFLGGGAINTNAGPYSVVPGGVGNYAGGRYSFAAGQRAKANYQGDFVWADPQNADFNSTGTNQFLIRASGGVGINTNNPNGAALNVNGTVTASGLNVTGTTTLGALSASGNLRLSNSDLLLRGDPDPNHGLGWYGSDVAFPNKLFAGLALDGPVLYGWSGGGLGTTDGGQNLALTWSKQGNVIIDPLNRNDGALGPGLLFGEGGSGEGIASKRTLGGNRYGLDFYTGYVPRLSIANTGNVGIGTTVPDRPLAIQGYEWISFKNPGGSTAWHLNNYLGGLNFVQTGVADARLFLSTNGNVGIGTANPQTALHVAGQIQITGGNPGAGKVLISDANGLASWQPLSALSGLFGQDYTALLPDVIDNTVFVEISGVMSDNVVIVNGPGVQIQRISGFVGTNHNDLPGSNMEFPLVFEYAGGFSNALQNWYLTNQTAPDARSLSVVVKNLAGTEGARWNLFEMALTQIEPGAGANKRYTLRHVLTPDNRFFYERDPELFPINNSKNPATDGPRVEIGSVEVGFYPAVSVDLTNRTITLTFDYTEAGRINKWVHNVAAGLDTKHSMSIIQEVNDLEVSRHNYFGVFPIWYQQTTGFGQLEKLKEKVVLSYDYDEAP